MARILFVCKKRHIHHGYHMASVGLFNSATFTAEALAKAGHETKVVNVADGNRVDAEVFSYKPDVVIIEALWITPAKMYELLSLSRYKDIHWFIRSHSKTNFIANEGIALEWIREYVNIAKYKDKLHVSANHQDFVDDLNKSIKDAKVVYLPNVYAYDTPLKKPVVYKYKKDVINIACMGAIRIQKNQLIQAMAAIAFADKIGYKLRFHINATRVEQKSEPVLKNIRSLFDKTDHELIEHPWLSHEEFIELLYTDIDISLSCSTSETFNIVTADAVTVGLPVVVSSEISWVPWLFQADENSLNSIVNHMITAYYSAIAGSSVLNRYYLSRYNDKALKVWTKLLKRLN